MAMLMYKRNWAFNNEHDAEQSPLEKTYSTEVSEYLEKTIIITL
jgi:hypothetical protein